MKVRVETKTNKQIMKVISICFMYIFAIYLISHIKYFTNYAKSVEIPKNGNTKQGIETKTPEKIVEKKNDKNSESKKTIITSKKATQHATKKKKIKIKNTITKEQLIEVLNIQNEAIAKKHGIEVIPVNINDLPQLPSNQQIVSLKPGITIKDLGLNDNLQQTPHNNKNY